MTGQNANIDYARTNFEFQVLTKIVGKPTNKALRKIKKELAANGTSVTCDLGGGAHGHLGLVLDPTEYTDVSSVSYAFPAHPGSLDLTDVSTQYVRLERREDHCEQLILFREATNVRAAMLKQLAVAIPEMYIKRFRNKYTHALDGDIYAILNYLLKTYGKVTSEQVQEMEDTLRGRVFDITEPIILLFNEVEDLQEVATQNGNKYTDTQIATLGVRLIKKHE